MKLRKHDLEILGTSFVICLVFYVGRNSSWTSRHIAGAVLLAIGFIGWLTARLQIREFFAVTAQAQGLVTTGIYSKIRNLFFRSDSLCRHGALLDASLVGTAGIVADNFYAGLARAQRSPRPRSKIRRRLSPVPQQNLVLVKKAPGLLFVLIHLATLFDGSWLRHIKLHDDW